MSKVLTLGQLRAMPLPDSTIVCIPGVTILIPAREAVITPGIEMISPGGYKRIYRDRNSIDLRQDRSEGFSHPVEVEVIEIEYGSGPPNKPTENGK